MTQHGSPWEPYVWLDDCRTVGVSVVLRFVLAGIGGPGTWV